MAARPPLFAVWALPVAYAAAFAGVRAFAVTWKPEMVGNPEGWYFGRVVSVAGFHVHHVYVGAAVALAALAVLAWRRRVDLAGAIALGVGLALVVDEVGLVASGFTEYNVPWRTPLAVATGVALALGAFAFSRVAPRAPKDRA